MERKNSVNRTNPADAANLFVRNLLCDISEELGGFNEQHWKKTLKYFDNRCAYTGVKLSKIKTVQDHLIAHNRKDCGLHIYGNIVPASKAANAAKSNKDFESFIRNDTFVIGDIDLFTREERILKISEFQRISGYFEKLDKILNTINLTEFVNNQYDYIMNQAKDKKNDIKEYIKESIIENTQSTITSIEKDLSSKIEMWANKPFTNVHKIIAVVLQNEGIKRENLVSKIEEMGLSKNVYGAISGLMTNVGNNYGKIFQEERGVIVFCPDVKDIIVSYKWSI